MELKFKIKERRLFRRIPSDQLRDVPTCMIGEFLLVKFSSESSTRCASHGFLDMGPIGGGGGSPCSTAHMVGGHKDQLCRICVLWEGKMKPQEVRRRRV